MSESYETQISEERQNRANLINSYREEKNQEPTNFEYFPVSPSWRISGEITKRKPKPGVSDYKFNFTRIGVVKFEIDNTAQRMSLYKLDDTEKMYLYVKDLTSGKTSYGLGRFVPVIDEGQNVYIDFNLASTPACGHVEGMACPWAREAISSSIEAGEKAELKD